MGNVHGYHDQANTWSFEVLSIVGRGGMVYRARDTKLKREVAIKILPEEFSRDADRVARFQLEAEVLASQSSEHRRDLRSARSGGFAVPGPGICGRMDFGLAKAIENAPSSTMLSNSPTLVSLAATSAG
jgi:hypothetical protein